ncbi:hypothetical protein NDU88_011152 [Pleurodeles waltl]|uniref:Uncharacterized protein n=1 Tax=Pleurodeles waltl TaxID=8319 RepID=A0AAV7R281_PLEWA|nr:hypothetical protein NDU88_011152 [Pleurodeles waltl]
MSAGRRSWTEEESGAANWIRAALELRRSCRAASRVPLRGIVGRGSTSCSAVTCARVAALGLPELQEPVQGVRKLVLEAGTLASIPSPALEESVETMRENLRKNKEEIQQLKGMELDLQEKLEHLENNSRRNNLRILNVPEGVEGSDLKKYIASLIKKVIPLDETDVQIINDIQRVHRDPFRRNIKKPQRILVNFQTYLL